MTPSTSGGPADDGAREPMTVRRVDTTLNGRRVSTEVSCAQTLVEHLRDDMGLTGTKVSCDMQVCGTCTVLVDRHPVSACTYLAVDIDGRSVDTVEGLASGGVLNALQQAFLERGAFQCGFCTPGFLMTATALLEEVPDPTEDQVIEYLEGNICRCTGYRPIVDAILAAARAGRDDGPADSATGRSGTTHAAGTGGEHRG